MRGFVTIVKAWAGMELKLKARKSGDLAKLHRAK
jgi:hypothetical protein